MGTTEETIKMRKTNMRIFPIYKRITWDYLFFYTIDFLFFTQVKNISVANVILKDSFYSFFNIILQVPANIIVEFLGRRNSLILGNLLSCLYMVVVMFSRNLPDLILAEFICSMSFSIKNIAEPSLLNESIPPSKHRSEIFAKISAKGASGYYLLDAISKIIAGFLFSINGYLPIICSLAVLVLGTIVSIGFIEPIKKSKVKIDKVFGKQQLKEIKEGFQFVLRSERLKALILCSTLICTLLQILSSYNISLMEDLDLSSKAIGIIAAVAGLINAYASNKQNFVHKKLRNRTLFIISILLSLSGILSGVYGIISAECVGFISIVILAYFIFDVCNGLYYTMIDRYLTNFSNEEIDTKIFATNELCKNIMRTIAGLFASFLIDKIATAYCLIIIGVIFTIVFLLMEKYMKSRVGLKPEEYSKEERKYDEQKETQEIV